VAARVLHLSDLHIGHRESLEPLDALAELAARLEPELLLATGDLSHRGRPEQLERARRLLDAVGLPLLAVPGNHDIPYTFPARFTRTFEAWRAAFGEPEPLHSSPGLVVVGLSSVRPWRQQGGSLEDEQVAAAVERLRAAPPQALKVVALHHHLAAPPWRAPRKRPLAKRDDVVEAFAQAGAELVVSGHVHQVAIAERREFEALEDGRRSSLVLASVAGLGRPRPHRRGEARGVNLYAADESSLTVMSYAWDGSRLAEVAQRRFTRG
jgi:3',5'-cyclic AMP phosphodiesterase CpdA